MENYFLQGINLVVGSKYHSLAQLTAADRTNVIQMLLDAAYSAYQRYIVDNGMVLFRYDPYAQTRTKYNRSVIETEQFFDEPDDLACCVVNAYGAFLDWVDAVEQLSVQENEAVWNGSGTNAITRSYEIRVHVYPKNKRCLSKTDLEGGRKTDTPICNELRKLLHST